jgi:hypothetical protein
VVVDPLDCVGECGVFVDVVFVDKAQQVSVAVPALHDFGVELRCLGSGGVTPN